MKLTRRSALGAAAGAVIGGPAAANSVAGSLSSSAMERNAIFNGPMSAGNMAGMPEDPLEYYRGMLKQLDDVTPEEERYMRKNMSWGMDADIAALKSVSEGQKIRIAKNRQYERQRQSQRSWLNDIIAGVIRPDRVNYY